MPEDDTKKDANGDNNSKDMGNETKSNDETVTIKKSELDQIKSDRENYKAMGNKYKDGHERWETYQKEQAEKLERDKANDSQKNNQFQFDESKINEITRKTLRDANQKTAQSRFFKGYSDEERTSILAELRLSGNELTVDEINDRLEAALLEHKRKTGKLEEYFNSEKDKAKRQAFAENQMNQSYFGDTGDKNDNNSGDKLSQKGEYMAKVMHVDPEKVKKTDVKKDNVIDVLAKK